MAPTSVAGVVTAGSNVTAALSVMRLTAASSTPGSFDSARCTVAWHAAHVIPPTGMVRRNALGGDFTSVADMNRSGSLSGDRGLVPGVAQRFEDVIERAARRIEANLRRSDTHGVDLEPLELAQRLRHAGYAVPAGHTVNVQLNR